MDRSQNMGPNYWKYFLCHGAARNRGYGLLGVGCVDCVLDACLVCIGPGMAMDFGFTR